jgi:O-antigen/teichoic acid export membrane protein
MGDVVGTIVINVPLAPVTDAGGTAAAVIMIVASLATMIGLMVLALRKPKETSAHITKIWGRMTLRAAPPEK